jgi:hypothetical protein
MTGSEVRLSADLERALGKLRLIDHAVSELVAPDKMRLLPFDLAMRLHAFHTRAARRELHAVAAILNRAHARLCGDVL